MRELPSPVQRKHCRIEIIPLIDIMFFLLASFMMVSLQMDRTQNIKVNLPAATKARGRFQAGHDQYRGGQGRRSGWKRRQITLPELRLVLSNRFRLDTNLPVYISGDGAHRRAPCVRCLLSRAQCGRAKGGLHGRRAQQDRQPMKIRSPIRRKQGRAWKSFR